MQGCPCPKGMMTLLAGLLPMAKRTMQHRKNHDVEYNKQYKTPELFPAFRFFNTGAKVRACAI